VALKTKVAGCGAAEEHLVRNTNAARELAGILVVDDDEPGLATTGIVLRALKRPVYEATTGANAIELAQQHRLALALIDWRLPDMSGLDVATALKANHIDVPWILVSGAMDLDLATEAGRRGAIRTVSLPFDVTDVVASALRDVDEHIPSRWPRLPLKPGLRPPESAAERCAFMLLCGCDAPNDLKTLQEWASFVAVGYSTLTEACRLAKVLPQNARDFMRVLRMLIHTNGRADGFETYLKFSDSRTLRRLLVRSGIADAGSTCAFSFGQFLRAQRFVSPHHPLIAALEALMSDNDPKERQANT
jgi:CheY-like chemotaxis protein